MKALFYTIALLVILAGAYFSYDLKSKFEDQLESREMTEAKNKTVSKNADETDMELKSAREALSSAKSEKAELEASISKLQADYRSLERELGDIDALVNQQDSTIQEAENALVEAKAALSNLGLQGDVNMQTIGDTIQGLEDQKKVLVQEIGELETVIEGANSAVATNREEIRRQQSRQAARTRAARQNRFSAPITAVDQNWGFVVVGAGRGSGLSQEDRLIVERNGRRIAELTPSSIEAGQTIAEIDLDTIAPGVALQAGDRVILSKAN